MKKKQIKQIISKSFDDETPVVLDKIIDECKNTKQIEPALCIEPKKQKEIKPIFKISFALFACVLFVLGLFLGNLDMPKKVMAKEVSVYLDVNPSIEIQIDENRNVIDCIAGNEDGQIILSHLILDGVNMDTALYAIVGAMYSNGYLNSDANSILVSVDEYENTNSIVLADISQQIENIFKENEYMKCSIIAQKFETSEHLKEKAKEYEISVGKMHLIEKIISNNELYSSVEVDELANMSIHELDLIYQSMVTERKEDEVIKGNPSGFIEDEEALNSVLTHLNITLESVEQYEVVALYHNDEKHQRKMIYLVSLLLKDSGEKIKYIVDCNTGEILPENTVDEWKDKIPNDGHFGNPNDKEPPEENHENSF